MPCAIKPRRPRLVAQLETPHFQQLGPALRTLTAVEQIARKRAITEPSLAARAGVSLATVKTHLKRLRAGGFVQTRRLSHGLVIDIAPSPARLFLPVDPSSVDPLMRARAAPGPALAGGPRVNRSTDQRQQLILDHQPMLRRVARHCAKSLPYWLEEDDLVSAGQLGLVEAADKFDPERGIPFAGFAYRFIRGRIIDANRRRNYEWELYDRLDGGDTGSPLELSRDASDNDERIYNEQLRAIVDSAIAALDERDRLACETYLADGTLKQLGARLGMTESGACLVRNKARERLREALAEMGVDGSVLD